MPVAHFVGRGSKLNTPSHWLMTVAIGRFWKSAGNSSRFALGLGSIAPDVPLYLMSFGGIAFFKYVKGWEGKRTFRHLFDELYFNDPLWIGFHNFLHSPTNLFLLAVVTFILRKRFPQVSRWTFYFLTACLFHSVADIVTHHDDGPVLFFPFDWKYRFSSPVSYWDPNHFGRPFMVFETLLNLVLIVLLLRSWWAGKRLPADPASGHELLDLP